MPSSACLSERPRRFFVSQRSAFQPRAPRGTQHTHSESRLTAGPPSGNQTPRHGYFLRLSGAYHSQIFEDGNEESPAFQGLDTTSDVGVRYGIQLLSTHIDNMQRLCRARLEILQLQHIRCMWEDLQQQITSLHVAVRDSTFALRDAQDRRRRRFRLYSHSNENSGLGSSSDLRYRQNNCRSGESGPSATEQGPHIPSVSQMLESARISDVGPPSSGSQTPASSSGGSAVREDCVDISDQGASYQRTLARLHTQFTALKRLKFVMDKTDGTRKEGETSKNNVTVTSRNVTTNRDIAQPVDTPTTGSNTVGSSDGELTVSQSTNFTFDNSSRPDSAESADNSRKSDSVCRSDSMKMKNVRHTAEMSSRSDETSDTCSPCKKTREEVGSNKRSAQSDCSVSVTVQDVCSGSDSSIPIIPTITTTTATTATTVTASSAMDPYFMRRESEDLGHQLSSCLGRYPQASLASAPSSVNITGNTATSFPVMSREQRLRICRSVYFRRPRLLALGPRSRAMSRQLSSRNTTSHMNYGSILR